LNIFKESVKWYRLAADQGYALGQNNLGNMYDNGLGVPQSYKEATIWYRLSADQGCAKGQYNLGVMYATGEGALENLVVAYALFNVASANDPGDHSARKNRDIARNRMTSSQLEAGQRLSRELMRPGNFLEALDAATQ
jgi:TPR repeat protein